jgi:hypothetical protein
MILYVYVYIYTYIRFSDSLHIDPGNIFYNSGTTDQHNFLVHKLLSNIAGPFSWQAQFLRSNALEKTLEVRKNGRVTLGSCDEVTGRGREINPDGKNDSIRFFLIQAL